MYGAILGEIISSRLKFDRDEKLKHFKLFTGMDSITDGPVITAAVAEALIASGSSPTPDKIRTNIDYSMKCGIHNHPFAGQEGLFDHLILKKNYQPYNNWGKKLAMRVSAAGWLYNTIERTREVARTTADINCSDLEFIKGAECIAAVIFLSRNGVNKEYIKKYAIDELGYSMYDLCNSVGEYQMFHAHMDTRKDYLPKALVAFFQGKSYVDVVKKAVSFGGDTDTLAAIAGAIAEAYYGIPKNIILIGRRFIPKDIKDVIERFDSVKEKGLEF